MAVADPQEARQEAVSLEAFQEEAHQEVEVHPEAAHQAAAHLEEDLQAHFREGDAHRMIDQTSSY